MPRHPGIPAPRPRVPGTVLGTLHQDHRLRAQGTGDRVAHGSVGVGEARPRAAEGLHGREGATAAAATALHAPEGRTWVRPDTGRPQHRNAGATFGWHDEGGPSAALRSLLDEREDEGPCDLRVDTAANRVVLAIRVHGDDRD